MHHWPKREDAGSEDEVEMMVYVYILSQGALPSHFTVLFSKGEESERKLYIGGRQPVVCELLVVRKKNLVIQGETCTLFVTFMFVILFHYILIRLCFTDTGSLTIFALLRCIKFTFHELR